MKFKKCYRCKTERELKYFTKDHYKKDGFRVTCKLCYGVLEKDIREHRPTVNIGQKYCAKCNSIKYLCDFSKRKNSFAKESWCKKCINSNSVFWASKKLKEGNVHYRYVNSKTYARRAKIPLYITEQEYGILMSGSCYYCDEPLSSRGIQLDRINNDKSIGYIKDNVLPCCTRCNRMRGAHFTVEEAKIAIQAVIAFRKNQLKS